MAVVFCRQNLAIPTLCDTSAFGLRNAIARERGIAAYRAWLPFERIRPVNIPQGRGLGRRRSVTALYSFSGPDLVWQAYKNCWLAVSISLLSANAGALKQASMSALDHFLPIQPVWLTGRCPLCPKSDLRLTDTS